MVKISVTCGRLHEVLHNAFNKKSAYWVTVHTDLYDGLLKVCYT